MDADDVLVPGSTAHLQSLASVDDVIAYGATLICDENLRPTRTLVSTLQGFVTTECLLGRFETRLPAMLLPRRVATAAGPWNPAFRVSADWDFVLRALDHARVAGDQRVAFWYRRHSSSVSRNASIASGEDAWRRLIVAYFERHEDQRGTALERRAWAALFLNRGLAYWDAGQYPNAIGRLSRALFYDPRGSGRKIARVGSRPLRQLLRPDGRKV
jgi:hypothetical protein